MKKVIVSQTIADSYTDKEIVAFLASSLSALARKATDVESTADTSFLLGMLSVNLNELSVIAKALDKKMNGGSARIVG